jgi:hypothetical protein
MLLIDEDAKLSFSHLLLKNQGYIQQIEPKSTKTSI